MSVKKSPKIQKLVVNAIRKLQDVQGSTPREISNYISQEYDVPSTKITRQVRLALNRAVSYGILQRSQGGYYTCNREFLGGQQPQVNNVQPMDKGCHVRRRARMKCGGGGGKSRRRRKRAAGGGGCKSSGRRRRRKARSGGGAGCKPRRRSGRRSGGRRRKSRGGCGDGKSRRRRRGGGSRRSKSRCGDGGGGKSRRRRRRSKREDGKNCAYGVKRGDSGGKGTNEDYFNDSDKRRSRAASFSETRNENRSGSVTPSVSDDERLDDKNIREQNNESPEALLD